MVERLDIHEKNDRQLEFELSDKILALVNEISQSANIPRRDLLESAFIVNHIMGCKDATDYLHSVASSPVDKAREMVGVGNLYANNII